MSLAPGTRVGRYEVRALLGAGGMGEVYRAHDATLHRDVAVKVLPQALAHDPERVERFELEASAAGRLNHPNILTVYDAGVIDGSPFIVSELLEGETLRARLGRGAVSSTEAVMLAAAIADGLGAAHASGIAHRDLKPENLFLTRDGRVKVLDFGLAKLLEPSDGAGQSQTISALTGAGVAVGTVGYMAPEQVRGGPVDHRADVFALGAVLYEMVSGRRPFAASSVVDTLHAILHDDPPALTGVAARDPGLQRVVARSLRKVPDERYQSMRELADDLRQLMNAGVATGRRGRWPRRFTSWAIAAGLLSALGVGACLVRDRLATAARGAPRIASIAVLPLENLSRDAEQEYFSEGMTDALIADLAHIRALRVISRTSVMHYKGARKTLPEIARELGVDGIVEGSVLRAGNRVRITAQLIAAREDQHLWARSYERDLTDVLALQRDVAESIAREIRVAVTPEEQRRLAAVRAVDPRAHTAYLHGRHTLNQPGQESKERAIEYFRTAVETDPQFAPAYVGMSDAYVSLQSAYLPPKQVMPLAKAAAMKALELDPALPEAHSALGFVQAFYEWDRAAGEASFKQALAGNPGLAIAHDNYALLLAALGRHGEALREVRIARTQDPLSLVIMSDAAWVAYLGRRYDDMVSEAQKALAMDDRYSPAYAMLALGYEKLGRYDEAIALLEKGRQIDESSVMLELLGGAYAAAGRPVEARKVLADLERLGRERYVCPYEVATVYAGLGDRTQTARWLEKGVEQRADCMPWMHMDPKLDALRGTDAFKQIERRVGFDTP